MDSWDDVAATSEIGFSDQCGSIFQLHKAIFFLSIFFFQQQAFYLMSFVDWK